MSRTEMSEGVVSRNEESRRQFLKWAVWKRAGGTVEQDPQAAEIDDLITGMPAALKQTLMEVYLQRGGPSERAGRGWPENMIVRRLGQADRLLRDQLSVSRARRLRDADAARMALRLQAMARAKSGGPVIADDMAIAEDGAHRNESSMRAPLKPLSQQVTVITGASSGVGLATALRAAHRGAQLVLAARSADAWVKVVTAWSEQGAQPQREGRRRRSG